MKPSLENLNIALVHDWLTNMAGAEKVLLELSNLFSNATIYTSVYDSEKVKPFVHKDIRTSFVQKFSPIRSKRELLIPLTPFIFEQFDLGKYDLVISSTTMAAKGIITKPKTKHVCYCHTPPRYLWEPYLDPRANEGKFSWLRKIQAHKLRQWDVLAAERVDHFIANSRYVANRIKKYYNRDSVVVYPPVDISKFSVLEKESVKDYYLYVSRLVNYKKCDLIIEAFNKLGLPLKIIGNGPEKKYLQSIAKKNIEFLGFLSDDEIIKYYSEAKAFVFAAEEDFGIVPVEAMASGRPVIAFKKGGVAESVVDKETGILFEEQTADSLIEAINKFNSIEFDSKTIRTQAGKFSTEEFKKNFLDVLTNFLER